MSDKKNLYRTLMLHCSSPTSPKHLKQAKTNIREKNCTKFCISDGTVADDSSERRTYYTNKMIITFSYFPKCVQCIITEQQRPECWILAYIVQVARIYSMLACIRRVSTSKTLQRSITAQLHSWTSSFWRKNHDQNMFRSTPLTAEVPLCSLAT